MKMITPSVVTDFKVGDKVKLAVTESNYAQGYCLEVDEVYTVTGVHATGGGGGTLSLKGKSNPQSQSYWVKGSYGFSFFKKIVDSCDGISDEDLIEALKDRGYTGTLARITTTEVTL